MKSWHLRSAIPQPLFPERAAGTQQVDKTLVSSGNTSSLVLNRVSSGNGNLRKLYLYRAVDSSGATIDFLLSAKRDAAAAERFLGKALRGENHPAPRVINTDGHAGYPPAIM